MEKLCGIPPIIQSMSQIDAISCHISFPFEGLKPHALYCILQHYVRTEPHLRQSQSRQLQLKKCYVINGVAKVQAIARRNLVNLDVHVTVLLLNHSQNTYVIVSAAKTHT